MGGLFPKFPIGKGERGLCTELSVWETKKGELANKAWEAFVTIEGKLDAREKELGPSQARWMGKAGVVIGGPTKGFDFWSTPDMKNFWTMLGGWIKCSILSMKDFEETISRGVLIPMIPASVCECETCTGVSIDGSNYFFKKNYF